MRNATDVAASRSSRRRREGGPVDLVRLAEPLERRLLLSTTIASGQTLTGSIASKGQLVTYTYTATAGQTFQVNLGDATAASLFQPDLHVYGPNSVLAGIGDHGYYSGTAGYAANYFTSSSAEVTVTAAAAGTYTIAVQDYTGTETGGTYALELDAAPATQAADADGNGGAITSGQTKTGTINHFGDLDVYTFTATAGQTFQANVGDTAAASLYQPDLHVYGPNGALAGVGDHGYYSGTAGYAANYFTSSSAEVMVAAATAGTYTIVVQDYGGAESGGTYALELDAVPATQAADADGNGGAITSGQTKTGTINHFGDLDVYTFTATAGQTFQANVGDTAAASLYQPDLHVYGPNGVLAGVGDHGYYSGTAGYAANYFTGSSAEVMVTAASAGTYTIIVQDYGGAESGGTYALDLDAVPATQAADADGNGGAITSGQTKSGTINHFGDLDVYTFTALAGQTIRAAVGDTAAASLYQPDMHIYGPNGVLAGTGDHGYYQGAGYAANYFSSSAAEVVITAASAGTYTIIVQDFGGAETGGTYALELDATPAAQAADADGNGGAIASGQTKAGTINHFGDLDVFTFTATAGDSFKLTLADPSSASLFQPDLHVYGTQANPIGTGTGYYTGTGYAAAYYSNTSVIVAGTATTSGVYTVEVEDFGAAESGGTYDLTLSGTIHPVTPAIALTAPAAQSATTSVAKSFSLGSFTAAYTSTPFTVTVNWGDGTANTTFTTTTTGTIAAQAHTFASAGAKTVSVSVVDATGAKSTTATFAVTVSAAVTLTVTPPPAQTAVAGTAKLFTLGSFTSSGGTAPYAVDIAWGDGSADTKFSLTAAGTITAQSHTYAAAATDTVSITVTDAKGNVSNKATFAVTVTGVVKTASISGTVFNDANANGVDDATELGLGLWQVYIDANNDGKYDAGDTLATTDVNGAWSFTGLAAGTYAIRVVQVTGTATTTTGGALQTITLAAGQSVVGKLFGEKRIS